MKIATPLITVISLTLCACIDESKNQGSNEISSNQEISFYTPDSIKIIGDLYDLNKDASTILLFHQGGSNARGEYGPIIPKLTAEGFNILAIDQRSGGQYYGNYNRTLANEPTHIYGDGYGYCDAYNNLEGALNYIIDSGFTGKKIIWGSSYSASLAIKLAHNRPNDIGGVLAFSPASGGSMKDCIPNQYLKSLNVPLIIFKPPSEMESENSKSQFELAQKYNHQTFIPSHGVHGSSMLVEERVGHPVDKTWDVVYAFLNELRQ